MAADPDDGVMADENAPQDSDGFTQAMAGPDWMQRRRRSSTGSAPRKRKRRKMTRRRILIGTGLFVLLVALGVGWLLYSGVKARTELQAAREAVHTLRSDITAGNLPA